MLYLLKESTDLSVIGKNYPQIQEFDKEDLTQTNLSITDCDGKISSTFHISRMIVEKEAKITDLLSSSPMTNFLILSSKVTEKFAELNLGMYQIFSFDFLYKNRIYGTHNAMYFVRNPEVLNLIDWDKSKFYKTKDWHKTILDEYKFTNWDEMRDFHKQFWGHKDFSLLYKLKINYENQFDLVNFRYPGFPSGYVCTEKLKNLIENEGFTGFAFEMVNDEYFV
ncbi:MAG: hypothetical protein WBP08_02165 [Saprospiraceae bacterium]